MNAIHITLTILGGITAIFYARAFDSIVRRTHEAHHELWVSLGSPPGWFWCPSDAKWFNGARARQYLLSEVFLTKPDWLKADPALCQRWRRMFALLWVWWSIPVAMMVNGILHPL